MLNGVFTKQKKLITNLFALKTPLLGLKQLSQMKHSFFLYNKYITFFECSLTQQRKTF